MDVQDGRRVTCLAERQQALEEGWRLALGLRELGLWWCVHKRRAGEEGLPDASAGEAGRSEFQASWACIVQPCLV